MSIQPTDLVVSYRGIRDVVRAGLQVPMPESAQEDDEAVDLFEGLEDALDELQAVDRHPGVMVAPEHGPASLLLSFMAEQAANDADALLSQEKILALADGGYEVTYDDHDLTGWVGSFFTWWQRIKGKHEWKPAPTNPTPIQEDVRIAILGDWGSGRYGAPICSKSIDRANPSYDAVIHLGDVYYAGTEKEVDNNFLAHWPEKPPLSRACNSNHEMYTGGYAYFEKTLPRFKQPGGSSNFAIANCHWLLIGLDTAYKEHDVEPQQLEWLRTVLDRADGRRVLLFSHHQPFSFFEKCGDTLRDHLGGVVSDGRVNGWYWGHEHRCVLYEKHDTWGVGRCVGHSGFPYFRDAVDKLGRKNENPDGSEWRKVPAGKWPAGIVLDGANKYVRGHEADYGPHGYASLEFLGQDMIERVHAADGTILNEEEF